MERCGHPRRKYAGDINPSWWQRHSPSLGLICTSQVCDDVSVVVSMGGCADLDHLIGVNPSRGDSVDQEDERRPLPGPAGCGLGFLVIRAVVVGRHWTLRVMSNSYKSNGLSTGPGVGSGDDEFQFHIS